MIKFLLILIDGAFIGVFTMCLLQINRYESIEEDSKEEKWKDFLKNFGKNTENINGKLLKQYFGYLLYLFFYISV